MWQYWSHFKYTMIHKWYVFVECCKRRIIWRGIKHDMSKFLPSEFFAYANFFFHEDGTRRAKGIDSGLYSRQIAAFDKSWVHHANWNDHHWNYWAEDPHNSTLTPDAKEVFGVVTNERQAVIMSIPAMKELIADMIGASKAQGNPDPEVGAGEFFYAHKDRIVLHPLSRLWIGSEFESLARKGRKKE